MPTPTPFAGVPHPAAISEPGCFPPSCLEIPPASAPTTVSCFSVVGYSQQPNCGGLVYDFPFDPAVGPAPNGPSFAPFLCRTFWGFRQADGSCQQVEVLGSIAGPRPDCEVPSWLASAPTFIQQAWCDIQRFGEQYCNSDAFQACMDVCIHDTSETGGSCFDCLASWALSCSVLVVQNILTRLIRTVRDWWAGKKPPPAPGPPPRDPPIPTSLDTGRISGGSIRLSAFSSPALEVQAPALPGQEAFWSGAPHAREGLIPMVPALANCGCDEQSTFKEEEFEWLASTPTRQAPQLRAQASAVQPSPHRA